MKVLHIIETLGLGGAEFALLNLLPTLKPLGIVSVVCVLNNPTDLQSDFEEKGIIVICLAGISFSQKRIAINRFCKMNEIDIVHSHLTRSLIMSGFLKGKFKRVCSYHNLGYDAQPTRNIKAWAKKVLAIYSAKFKVDVHVGVSKSVITHYKKHYRIANFFLIANSIFVPSLNLNCNNSIVVPGRLVKEKGHLLLLDTIKNLVSMGMKNQWVFAGGGSLHNEINDKVTQLKLEKTVTITGVLKQDKLFRIMAQAQFVVLPSLFEGFGMAAVEAMMLGKAVIVSDAGGLSDIVDDNKTGLVFSKGNKMQMLEKIKLLLNDKQLCTRLASAGKKFVEQKYSVNVISLKWNKLYKGLIN